MAEDEIRLYEVSDPRKSFAGHTVYRVSRKVCQDRFPGVVEEVVVWRRFNEFKKLQKDLLKLYNPKLEEVQFPCLPKATFFDRFDEAVIEERRRGSLNLLNFAASIPQLAKSQCFRNFFQGGIYQRSACSRSSSKTSSFSSDDGDITESHIVDKDGKCATTHDSDESQGYLELGGVWLCKQPSLVEGLDKTETNVDETIYEQSTDLVESQISADTPSFIRRSLSVEEGEEDVFGKKEVENSKEISWDLDGEDGQILRRTTTWLQRAISLCSEGDDIETLACEAENDEYVKELNFPKPFAVLESDCVGNSVINVQQILNTNRGSGIESKRETVTQEPTEILSEYRGNQKTKYEPCEPYNSPKSTSNQEDPGDFSVVSKENQKETTPCRFHPQDISFLSDSTGDDYLLAAAKVVRQALNFELDGQYEEAFHLYKKCVSLLLSGVQGEKDAKRRDAVRRKTAQYLLKAEALYTACVQESKELSENTFRRLNAVREDSNHHQEVPSQLQLANYSVIGIVGKVTIFLKFSESYYRVVMQPVYKFGWKVLGRKKL
uniref:Ribosomal protein S6 kinase delta-1-like n=1 Tax=Actinia tenebrosa TaxID=6105 RepID=A0A6P8I5Y5_ACTTE